MNMTIPFPLDMLVVADSADSLATLHALALAQAVDTETVAAAAISAGLRGPAIGQAVARARAQALADAQLPSAIEAH